MLPKAPTPPAIATSNPTLLSPTLPAPTVDPAAFELSYWNSIQNSTDAEDFKDYLAKYPNGQFASIARRRMAALTSATKPAPTSTPGNTVGNTTSTARPAGRSQQMQSRAGIEFVWIPAGSFMMGSENGGSDEKPVHRVTIADGFYIGKYEVTQAQWQAVMGNNPSNFKGCDNCPVEQVSWDDAVSFIAKLNAQNDGYTYRLPTEAEWEYAARAGTTTAFAFGDSLSSEQANFDGDYPYGGAAKGVYRQTRPVGSFQPNAFGLFDMHGNVWEWCQDWYHGSYAGAPTDGSAWLSGGEQKYRMLRGGSWLNGLAFNLRSADRNWDTPDLRNVVIGFRVVAVVRT
ncbi:MAG: hypothetical protein DMF64_06825 [Acidobacteria bacterium]|nr:MAG: hypothetical protein DMF64_06825 [Acidobacteriota bacterium]